MTRVDASLSEPLAALLDTAIAEGHFKGTSDAARMAVREHFDNDVDARFDAVLALIEAQAPPESADEESLSLADVVRLTGHLPADLPEDIQAYYDIPAHSSTENSDK